MSLQDMRSKGASSKKCVSPLAPGRFPDMPAVQGVRMASGRCGIRHKSRSDILLMVLAHETSVAGVFTQSKTASAPVEWCRKILKKGMARMLIANSGNANAFTGKAGVEGVERYVNTGAEIVKCSPDEVFAASTGVIGEPLPDAQIIKALSSLLSQQTDQAWKEAATAIMTTDTFPKGATRTAKIGNGRVTIAGIAKGSGMIAPDMGTMLGFIFTDAKLPHAVLQPLLTESVERSFNAITVDSDTSTSDTVLLFATGKGEEHPSVTNANDLLLADFKNQLEAVMVDLAHQIVKDGEGATKFITVEVTGAENNQAAKRIGMSIANSPLVKTAVAGEDANWGRIVMAVGKAGEKADRDKLRIKIGDTLITESGHVLPDYDEMPVQEHMQGQNIRIAVDIGVGNGKFTVWTCDLTHGYISINADYRS